VPPVTMFYLCINSWRLLRRGHCEKRLLREIARLPEGVAGFTENSRAEKTIISGKTFIKRLGMPHFRLLPPFRLRYGGFGGKCFTTELAGKCITLRSVGLTTHSMM
jgi:hypothetical protein